MCGPHLISRVTSQSLTHNPYGASCIYAVQIFNNLSISEMAAKPTVDSKIFIQNQMLSALHVADEVHLEENK